MTETSSLDTCPPHLADEKVELRRDATYHWAAIFAPPSTLFKPEYQTTVRELWPMLTDVEKRGVLQFSLMTDLDKTKPNKSAMAYDRDWAEVDFGNQTEVDRTAVNLYNDGEIRIWREFKELRK